MKGLDRFLVPGASAVPTAGEALWCASLRLRTGSDKELGRNRAAGRTPATAAARRRKSSALTAGFGPVVGPEFRVAADPAAPLGVQGGADPMRMFLFKKQTAARDVREVRITVTSLVAPWLL